MGRGRHAKYGEAEKRKVLACLNSRWQIRPFNGYANRRTSICLVDEYDTHHAELNGGVAIDCPSVIIRKHKLPLNRTIEEELQPKCKAPVLPWVITNLEDLEH